MTRLGEADTTGLPAMDYRVTGAVQDPQGMTERFHAERLMRLPRCCWCYAPDPPAENPPAPEPPSVRAGVVTFGSMNKIVKASPAAVELWSRVMRAVPGSRMMVAALGGEGNASARRYLEGLGLPGGRLVVADKSPTRAGYLRRFDGIDVALDPLPFCGITTTCDSLWMGVPVVTLAGGTSVARAGASALAGAGFPEWAAGSPEEYVNIAASLARDAPYRQALRARLRSTVLRSLLCDGAGLARELEAAIRHAWRAWCVQA